MHIFSQLISAQLENKASDYSAGVKGRIWHNTSSGLAKLDDGSSVRTFVTTDNTQTLTNKSLSDSTTYLIDDGDATKIAKFQCSGITTATTRTFTFPDASTTLIGTDNTATLTNKTWNGATIGTTYGGTGLTSFTTGDVIYCSSANTLSKLAIGTSGLFLKSNGSTIAWDSVAQTFAVASKSANYTVTTSDNEILCDDSGGNITLTLYAASGNSGKQVLVKKTVSSTNTITIDANSSETIDGQLTLILRHQYDSVTLLCDGSNWHILDIAKCPTQQTFTSGSAATYTTPAGCRWLKVRMVGAGGGGGGSGTSSSGGTGGAGSATTTFGTSLLACSAGNGGNGAGTGGSGGSASVSSPAFGTAVTGSYGSAGGGRTSGTATSAVYGGVGGCTPFGGAGSGGTTTGNAAIANSGGGGGGGGSGTNNDTYGGGGGGAGGYVEAIIRNPSSTYTYTIATGGTAGSAGTSGNAGGAGAAGYIEVTEFY